MYLSSLSLQNFRNYTALDLKLNPAPGITILLGTNAQGKTNILESISMLAFPRSFRAYTPNDLIAFGQNYYVIDGSVVPADESRNLSLMVGYQKKPVRRTYKINSAEVSLKEYLTNFQTVLFTPEDIEILNGAPSLRRRLIDTIISQVNREYFQYLIEFSRVLKQRNALIKKYKERKVGQSEMLFWDNELVRLANEIHLVRFEFIEFVREHLATIYAEISGTDKVEVAIDYKYSGHSRMGQYENFKDAFKSLIEDDFSSELDAGHTLFGPHRDDFELKLDGRLVSEFCSRGEKRSFSLVLKLIEIKYLQKIAGTKPILLLDDVFSELDESRRKKLLELASEYQTLITTVEKNYFADYSGEIEVFTVANQEVLRYN